VLQSHSKTINKGNYLQFLNAVTTFTLKRRNKKMYQDRSPQLVIKKFPCSPKYCKGDKLHDE
jgi:hypothetical protein